MALGAIRCRLRSEAGFGLVEVLTGAVLLAVGLVGALAAFDGAGKLTYASQRHEQAISLAQEEAEEIKSRSFAQVALNAAPAAQAADDPNNPSDPRAYVDAGSFKILTNYHDASQGAPAGVSASGEPLVVDSAAGSIAPGPENVVVGDTTATVYRFITRRDESCVLSGTTTDLCPSDEASRRITVAVRPTPVGNGAGPHKPVYASTVVTDPQVEAVDQP